MSCIQLPPNYGFKKPQSLNEILIEKLKPYLENSICSKANVIAHICTIVDIYRVSAETPICVKYEYMPQIGTVRVGLIELPIFII